MLPTCLPEKEDGGLQIFKGLLPCLKYCVAIWDYLTTAAPCMEFDW